MLSKDQNPEECDATGDALGTEAGQMKTKISINLQTMATIEILKSKIHRVRVTDANLNYIGSITIDEDLMDAANIIEFEKVQIVNNNNGERLETYVIKGERGTGTICLNGAAARKVQKGDILIIVSYISMDPQEARSFTPTIIFPNEENKIA